jgi:pimeloyl-ACP methyl ester carboxylesterase
MTRIEVEPGVELYVQDVGDGPPVVLIAGFGMSHPVWDAEVCALAEAGRRAVCVDLRGTGSSDKPLHGYRLERLTDDLQTALRRLGLSGATLVGWSFGGQIAFNLAARGGELVSRLVLVASGGARSGALKPGAPADGLLAALQAGERGNRLAARRQTVASGFADEPDPDTLRLLLDVQLRMPSWAALACYETYLMEERADRVADVAVPVLLLFGDRDPVTPRAGQAWLADNLPDARTVVLEGSGHYPMFEAGPAFRAALLRFLSEPSPGPDLGP